MPSRATAPTTRNSLCQFWNDWDQNWEVVTKPSTDTGWSPWTSCWVLNSAVPPMEEHWPTEEPYEGWSEVRVQGLSFAFNLAGGVWVDVERPPRDAPEYDQVLGGAWWPLVEVCASRIDCARGWRSWRASAPRCTAVRLAGRMRGLSCVMRCW